VGKALAGWALGVSIATIVLFWIPIIGILLWLAALTLSITAMVKCKTSEDGRGMAIAALIIAIVGTIMMMIVFIGALAYFGVMSPDNFLPSKCVIGPPFSCTEYKVTPAGTMVGVVNNAGADIESAVITVSGDCADSAEVTEWKNGEKKTLTLCQGLGRPIGDQTRFDMNIEYTKTGDVVSHTVTGNIMSKVES